MDRVNPIGSNVWRVCAASLATLAKYYALRSHILRGLVYKLTVNLATGGSAHQLATESVDRFMCLAGDRFE